MQVILKELPGSLVVSCVIYISKILPLSALGILIICKKLFYIKHLLWI
jgi:hypothetical protein